MFNPKEESKAKSWIDLMFRWRHRISITDIDQFCQDRLITLRTLYDMEN